MSHWYFWKAFAVGFLVVTLHPLALTLNAVNSASPDITVSPSTAGILQKQSF